MVESLQQQSVAPIPYITIIMENNYHSKVRKCYFSVYDKRVSEAHVYYHTNKNDSWHIIFVSSDLKISKSKRKSMLMTSRSADSVLQRRGR